MQRYFIELSYKGTQYHGWQIQPNAITVQEVLDKALHMVLREKVATLGCGRTDTGVHATQFYAHVDSAAELPETFFRAINAVLPVDIAVKRILPVHGTAHARFDASSRSYEYHIHFHKNPFKDGSSWLQLQQPNMDLMNKAAAYLLQFTDFSCFSKSNTQVFTNNCKISTAVWKDTPDGMVFCITADRFLRNMVRAIVGTLLEIGFGKMKPNDIIGVINSKNRSEAGTSVPAHGLYLTEVVYPYITEN